MWNSFFPCFTAAQLVCDERYEHREHIASFSPSASFKACLEDNSNQSRQPDKRIDDISHISIVLLSS